MLFFILIAAAVFWAGISIGIFFGRRHRLAATQPAPPAVAAPTTAMPATAPAAQLQPGDRVVLRAGQAETTLVVDPEGNVVIPVVGKIRAQYLTPAQLEQAIAQNYKARNLIPPGTIQIVPAPATAPTAP
jgi:protein involved in polysaccharide export with SLBB domain